MENNTNTEYEDGKKNIQMNDDSKKIMSCFSTFLKIFSMVIILFLTMSYISNKYIPGLFMNYIPMFFPFGKTFYKKIKLVSLFHSPLDNYADQTKFFEEDKEIGDAKYYKLLSFGSSLFNVLKGGIVENPQQYTDIPECKVYLLDDKDLYWYQKIIVSIFGAIQMFIGPFLSLFCAFAYIFSGKIGYFLNAVKMRNKMKREQDEDLFENNESQTNKLLFKSGGSKFSSFFNFLNFIPVDKLSYGSTYFMQKEPTPGKIKYFFLILFIIIFYSSYRSSTSWFTSIIILIAIFVFYSKYISEPYADFKSFLNIKAIDENIKDLNEYAEMRDRLKENVLNLMKEHTKKTVKPGASAPPLNNSVKPVASAPPLNNSVKPGASAPPLLSK